MRNLRAACSGRENARKQADRKRVNKNPGNKGFITDSIDEETSEMHREHIGNASRYDTFDTFVENNIDNNPATMRFAAEAETVAQFPKPRRARTA